MSNEKYKNKIRKLLALAQSDNPHEAERAKVQAQKLMAKHNIHEGDVEIITTSGKAIKRKNIKKSEAILVSAILRISGCEGFSRCESEWDWGSQRYKYENKPHFIGLQHDAELAAYSWDVLLDQLLRAQRVIKKEHPTLGANEIERYSEGWVLRAATKLENVFGERKPPENVTDYHNRRNSELKTVKPRAAKSTGDKQLDTALENLGYRDGKKARLHNAASDQREKQSVIEYQGAA